LQRILDRAGDAGLRVRQRAVEVEEDRVHGSRTTSPFVSRPVPPKQVSFRYKPLFLL
jgi:hypothetical protein